MKSDVVIIDFLYFLKGIDQSFPHGCLTINGILGDNSIKSELDIIRCQRVSIVESDASSDLEFPDRGARIFP